jgi:hypothetical protein
MGTLSVKFDGKSAFDWTGDEAEIDGLGAAFRTAAKNVKLKPDVFADNAVRHFAESGFLTADPVGQEMHMMAIVYFILSLDSGHPTHPGKIRDYLPACDFDVDLRAAGGSCEANIVGTSRCRWLCCRA